MMLLENTENGLNNSQVTHIARGVMDVKLYSLASFVMLFYDILITFGEEVEHIWQKKFTCFTMLWFLNRYLSPLGFIIIIISFNDQRWTEHDKLCNAMAIFPEILRTCTTIIIGLIFICRLYATFGSSKSVLVSMMGLLVFEEALKIWSFTSAQRLQLPPGLVGCILTTGPNSLRFAFTWIAELIFDSTVFVLTLYRTVSLNRTGIGRTSSLVQLIQRDGLIYFAIILATNLATVFTFLFSTTYLKAVNASFTVSITTLMVSRLILNLRAADRTVIINARNVLEIGETSIEGGLIFALRDSIHSSTATLTEEDRLEI